MRPLSNPVKQAKAARRILVVDDSANMRLYLKTILISLGYSVAEASNGVEGFDRILAEEFDLVVTDLNMKPMSGYELIAAIGLLPSWRRPRIIVCTATEMTSLTGDAELKRVDRVLTKPVNLSDMARAVSEALQDVRKVCGA
jgi:CheY-like chemotaxis protein